MGQRDDIRPLDIVSEPKAAIQISLANLPGIAAESQVTALRLTGGLIDRYSGWQEFIGYLAADGERGNGGYFPR
ncbi:hypothetical protein [Aeromonas hydrophila]|uniref:hypothetical protein n=1 Tax=Aeromonas hydrophila TaxID=644 RepID=UPI00372D0D4C